MPVGPTSTPKPENGAPPPTIVPPSDIDPPPSDTETSVFKKPWFWALVAAGTLATGGVVFAVARRTIRAEAEAGARAGVKKEIPVIEKKVRAEAEKAARAGVKPMVIGAVTASGVAAALGIAAFVIAITR
jgi:hypothetical protein